MEGLVATDDFWRGRRVLLTGHTGFKGAWLSIWLQELGASVTAVALAPIKPSLFEVGRVSERMSSVFGDIRDASVVRDIVQEAQPELIIHMAAQALVRRSYVDPIETYSTNVLGTVNLLDAARHCESVRAIVSVTSDKCYRNHEWDWGYREVDELGGHDPYSNSKACAELVTAAFRDSFFSPAEFSKHGVVVSSARAGNVIGGADWSADRLVPDTVAAFAHSRPVAVRSPNAVRPWQHVLEPLSGYLLLARGMLEQGTKFSGAWNFGPADEDARPVSWIVERLAEMWGKNATWVIDKAPHPHEARYLKLDCSKARSQLDWSPRWSLECALQRVVEWHRAFEAGQDMRAVTVSQIAQYMAAAPAAVGQKGDI